MKCDLCYVISWIILISIDYISELYHFMNYGVDGQGSIPSCGILMGFIFTTLPRTA